VLLGILIAASVSAVSDDAIRLQAVRCGLKADQLVWTNDAEGHVRADVTPKGELDSFSFTSMRCLLDWAAKSGPRVGFISEPAPVAQPSRSVPIASPVSERVVQEWQDYLLKRRQYLMAQLRYAATHKSRLEEVTKGKRTDVSGDWLDRTQSEYGEVTQLLIDAGLLTEAQARADAARKP
jgi:hypothetical protein